MKLRIFFLLLILLPLNILTAQQKLSERDEYLRIVTILKTLNVNLEFEDTSFEDAIRFIQGISNINIVIDPVIYKKLSKQDLKVTFKVHDLKLESALKIILEQRNLSCALRDGVLFITTKERSVGTMYMRIYDIRDLIFRVKDFPGPSISIAQSKGGEGGIGGVNIKENEAQKSPFNDAESLLQLIKANTGKGSWDNPEASASIHGGVLIVVQTYDVHQEIMRLVLMLRAAK